MSKELADSIVLAAQKMERNEVEVISLIRYYNPKTNSRYEIKHPVTRQFLSFESAYNYLVMTGYQEVSQDRDTHFRKSLEVTQASYPVLMVMSKKVNKE
jgi:hypothetical protein